MSRPEAPWRAVPDADGCPYAVHEYTAACSVAERKALTFPRSQAVKTLACTTPDIPLPLVALRAEDRVDSAVRAHLPRAQVVPVSR
ncbi:hypothetical protein ABZ545_30605 [Streptomyces abikoensis]|uniref:hypothetical protein n=1 Tax=Streptomyces abikoensis TaxID=97398 RepID=UPI0033DEC56F